MGLIRNTSPYKWLVIGSLLTISSCNGGRPEDDSAAPPPSPNPDSIAGINALECQAYEPATSTSDNVSTKVEVACALNVGDHKFNGSIDQIEVSFVTSDGSVRKMSYEPSDKRTGYSFIITMDRSELETLSSIQAIVKGNGEIKNVEAKFVLSIKQQALLALPPELSIESPIRRRTTKKLTLSYAGTRSESAVLARLVSASAGEAPVKMSAPFGVEIKKKDKNETCLLEKDGGVAVASDCDVFVSFTPQQYKDHSTELKIEYDDGLRIQTLKTAIKAPAVLLASVALGQKDTSSVDSNVFSTIDGLGYDPSTKTIWAADGADKELHQFKTADLEKLTRDETKIATIATPAVTYRQAADGHGDMVFIGNRLIVTKNPDEVMSFTVGSSPTTLTASGNYGSVDLFNTDLLSMHIWNNKLFLLGRLNSNDPRLFYWDDANVPGAPSGEPIDLTTFNDLSTLHGDAKRLVIADRVARQVTVHADPGSVISNKNLVATYTVDANAIEMDGPTRATLFGSTVFISDTDKHRVAIVTCLTDISKQQKLFFGSSLPLAQLPADVQPSAKQAKYPMKLQVIDEATDPKLLILDRGFQRILVVPIPKDWGQGSCQ